MKKVPRASQILRSRSHRIASEVVDRRLIPYSLSARASAVSTARRVEDELGCKLVVVDGKQPFDAPHIDQEIFAKLHRSAVIIADITASRPNCFLELGYALGRSLPVMLLARKDTKHPFDIETLAGHHWTSTGPVDERRRLFREHWAAIRNRPPLVPMEPLTP